MKICKLSELFSLDEEQPFFSSDRWLTASAAIVLSRHVEINTVLEALKDLKD